MARILVGYDGSPPARRALDFALHHARLAKDDVIVLNVVPANAERSSFSGLMPAAIELPKELGGTFAERARRRMDELLAEVAKGGSSVTGLVKMGEPAATLIQTATEVKADHIVIGHKSYESGLALGPNANLVVSKATVPVTVVP